MFGKRFAHKANRMLDRSLALLGVIEIDACICLEGSPHECQVQGHGNDTETEQARIALADHTFVLSLHHQAAQCGVHGSADAVGGGRGRLLAEHHGLHHQPPGVRIVRGDLLEVRAHQGRHA